MNGFIDDVYDTGDMAVDVGTSPEFLGGVAGIVAGATIGGLLASNLNFSSTLGNVVGASLVFLAGAALYGYGLSTRMDNTALRSATQVSGVVMGGMGLGRLLATLGAPTFGLNAEPYEIDPTTMGDDYGRMVGQDFHGRAVGQWSGAAEDEEDNLDRDNTDYQWDWRNAENFSAPADGYDVSKPDSFSPTMTERSPSWATGLSSVNNPWATAERMDIMEPSSPMGGVDQWYGSAEGVDVSPRKAVLGNMLNGAEGIGSVIGQ